MTLNRQLGLLPECRNELWSALHGLEAIACKGADLTDGVQAQVGQFALLHVAPNVFVRIELRSVCRQPFQNDVSGERFDEILDHPAAVRRQPVPDDEQLAADLVGERLQEFNELGTADWAGVEAVLEVPVAQAGDHRQLLPVKAVLENGRLPFRCPSLDPGRSFAQSRFVDEDDGSPFAEGLFFSVGQRLARQVLIAASSRCSARPAGRWLEKPSSRRMRQTCTVLYASPNSRSISCATRANVHNSLGKPLTTAPATNALPNAFFCSLRNPPGRPSGLRRHACTSSPSFMAQLEVVCRLTPSARATSACATPRANMRMPLRRRSSISLRSRLYRFVAMHAPRSRPTSINAHHSESVVIH